MEEPLTSQLGCKGWLSRVLWRSPMPHIELARGFFDWLDLGPISLKGFAEPVQVWRALRERQVASRFEASHTVADLWPLVDRRAERTLLSRWWSRVEASEGHVVQLSGEPGIGKSRLAVELVANLADKAFTTLRYYCSPYHQSSALYPIIKQLEGAARLLHDEPPEKKLDRIEDLLTRTGAAVDATARCSRLYSRCQLSLATRRLISRLNSSSFELLKHLRHGLSASPPNKRR